MYWAKRHGKCKNHHDPVHSAMYEADRYCREHGIPIPGEEGPENGVEDSDLQIEVKADA